MTLDQVIAAMKPFADMAELFEHNLGGVPKRGENFYTKAFSVNGVEKQVSINVADFYAIKAMHDFLTAQKPKAAEPPPPPPNQTESAQMGDSTEAEISKAEGN